MGLGHRLAPGQPSEAGKVELRGSAEILGCPWWKSAEAVGVLIHRLRFSNKCVFPKNRGSILVVPFIRITVFWSVLIGDYEG